MKTKTSHTPGPWMVSTRRGSELVYGGGAPVAQAMGANADANIFLIAAAPELLKAAKAAVDRLMFIEEYDSSQPTVALLKAAIAKAEGR